MDHHVAHVTRVCCGKLREIGFIRKLITQEVAQILVQSLVISCLDYGNGNLCGIRETLLDKLQRIQNAGARIILGYRKYDNISEGMMKLHWLPIRFRILFKIATITYKVLSTNQPVYLRNLLEICQSQRSLRSNTGIVLKVPKSKLKTAGDRAFRVAAPKIWNDIPKSVKASPSIAVFKTLLKRIILDWRIST